MGGATVLRPPRARLVPGGGRQPAGAADRARLVQRHRWLGHAQRLVGVARAVATRGMAARVTRRRAAGSPAAAPHLERLLWRVGVRYVAGVDEVGMGPLAGPVVAAAVVLPVETHIDGVADSKVLTAAVRERLAVEIRRRALAVGLAVVPPEEIDRVNIYQAGLLALRRAVDALRPLVPGFVLVDGR